MRPGHLWPLNRALSLWRNANVLLQIEHPRLSLDIYLCGAPLRLDEFPLDTFVAGWDMDAFIFAGSQADGTRGADGKADDTSGGQLDAAVEAPAARLAARERGHGRQNGKGKRFAIFLRSTSIGPRPPTPPPPILCMRIKGERHAPCAQFVERKHYLPVVHKRTAETHLCQSGTVQKI